MSRTLLVSSQRGGASLVLGHGATTPVALAPLGLSHRRRPLLAGNSRGGGARSLV